ncbi:MAG: Lrp/AsnC family transcriptional regulator [Gammaproteobacteria bacterium]|nr:Lrp/AsnC family transcriptional regulator [Gammaproteobacteria bacterium]NIR84932.1 Lrp/AsnC family transcriptional regulator [Gammaproteobacteria bacterium]NIR91781.1 Lrp/AsnC family transcriptional regulator [Gammaproteobacteria bacterium]NIU05979.1 Lrp/AsnC family transcriptional regulator [Gammaproteobacteria bacterium]NIV53026.1 Lrp/AsnC family transcriptional regulator [Gammaproteobacteria bacterium]
MVNAIVLLNVQRTEIDRVAEKLAETDGVSEVYSVAGRYDLVAVIRAPSNEALADVVTHRMLQLKGIEKTETLIAFRTYSRHDLEQMFAIGFSE